MNQDDPPDRIFYHRPGGMVFGYTKVLEHIKRKWQTGLRNCFGRKPVIVPDSVSGGRECQQLANGRILFFRGRAGNIF